MATSSRQPLETFRDSWPHYVDQHQEPLCRRPGTWQHPWWSLLVLCAVGCDPGSGGGIELFDPSQVYVGPRDFGIEVVESFDVITITVEQFGAEHEESISVNYATRDRTATAGSDYDHTSGTLTWEVGEKEKSFHISILDDGVVEGPEHLVVLLSDPRGARLIGLSVIIKITILDNDGGMNALLAATSGGTLLSVVFSEHGALARRTRVSLEDGDLIEEAVEVDPTLPEEPVLLIFELDGELLFLRTEGPNMDGWRELTILGPYWEETARQSGLLQGAETIESYVVVPYGWRDPGRNPIPDTRPR